MSDIKERLSVSVDASLAEEARRAVADGFADSVSSWMSEAMRRQIDHDRRLRVLDQFITEYETEHGEITVAEMDASRRKLAGTALVVRGAP